MIKLICLFTFLLSTSIQYGFSEEISHYAIAWQNNEGFTQVMTTSNYNPNLKKKDETEIEFLMRMASEVDSPYIILDTSDLPTYDYWFAWTISGNEIVIDMDRVRKRKMAMIRVLRNIALEDLDLKSLHALENEDYEQLNQIKAFKQELRDLPANFDISSFSLEELETVEPPQLDYLIREISMIRNHGNEDCKKLLNLNSAPWEEVLAHKRKRSIYF